MATNPSPRTTALDRRKVLAGGLAAGVVWTTPSIARLDRVAAAAGSCSLTTVNWTSITGPSGSTYTATGTSGTLSITATIVENLSGGASGSATVSGGRLVLTMSSKQKIGDDYTVSMVFADSSGGTVCTASTTVLDIDRNGKGVGCGTDARFEDNIDSVTGSGLVTTTFGNLVETPTGNFVSTLTCKTTDTENLGLSWTDATGVTGAGFRWVAGVPSSGGTKLDTQIVKLEPITLCVAAAGAGAAPPSGAAPSGGPVPLVVAVPEGDGD